MLKSLYQTVFPRVCYGCSCDLAKTEHWLCSLCKTDLPFTHFHRYPVNPVSQIFTGRIPLVQASSFFYFVKESAVQHLLHALKYHNLPMLGNTLGEWYAQQLKEDAAFYLVDKIMPVPLHYSKQKLRGYNQSEMFAKGLSDILEIPLDTTSLIRTTATATQTHKNRMERWQNVEDVFSIVDEDNLIGKHILLVDDVVTTGATLEACSNKILQIAGTSISIATIAFAKI